MCANLSRDTLRSSQLFGESHLPGPDDDYYRARLIDLCNDNRLRDVLPNKIQREVIAMYLGVRAIIRINDRIELITMSTYAMDRIVPVLMYNYRIEKRRAENIISDTFGAFVFSMATDQPESTEEWS